MPPSGPVCHFAGSLLFTLAAALAWALLFERPRLLKPPLAGVLLALTLGHLKEMHDLIVNGWSLSPAALRADCGHDMEWNLAGALAGAVLWGCARASGGALSRALTRRARGSASLLLPPAFYRFQEPSPPLRIPA
jgi:hypothetical protein